MKKLLAAGVNFKTPTFHLKERNQLK